MREMTKYMLELIRRRRQQPADDLLSKLATAEVDGARLADEEIVGFVVMLLLAEHVTTTCPARQRLLSFDRHPEAAAAVHADHDLLPVTI